MKGTNEQPVKKQVFQTRSRWRWLAFKWTGRLLVFVLVLMTGLVIVSLARGHVPRLPVLFDEAKTTQRLDHPYVPPGLNKKELKKYKGFNDFLLAREKNEQLKNRPAPVHTDRVRAAFYVDWDPQSFFSLQKGIGQLNMVLPEWFFIDPETDTLRTDIDLNALQLMRNNQVKIVPLINNINPKKGVGEFDGTVLHRILHDAAKRERLIADIIKNLQRYQLQGINIDFEEFKEKTDEPIIAFQQELYKKLHALNYIVTQDIMPNDNDFNVKALSEYNDYIFLMAYDEHYNTSVPGTVCSQRWIEKVLDETAAEVRSGKIVLCLAGYGYDWAENTEAATITYQQALATARQFDATIDFDNDTYNNHYSYTDGQGVKHEVYFTDAATNFNTIRFADEYGTAGTALWRLGSEDERLWRFYNRGLSLLDIQQSPVDFSALESVKTPVEKPDYIGEGEVLNVLAEPEPGKIALEVDSTEHIIAEQNYLQMPTRYVIKRYGVVHHQVVLTFDDGPDPVYTPEVLDILKKEKVPATFFIVGMEAENNLPLLRRIYNEGHEIGNHTFTHPNIAAVGRDRALTEMESTRLLLEAVTGHSTILFRAPYNADAEPTSEVEIKPIALSKQKNYYTVGESIDPEDWEEGVTADSVYARTIRQYESRPDKGIILFHDAGGNRQATVDALPRIIKYFKDRNIQFTTVASLLHTSKEVVMPEVHDGLVQLDGRIAHVGYWLERLLGTLFWLAIILGLSRVTIMLTMAIAQKIRKRNIAVVNDHLVHTPAVSIIVPAYNEEINAVKTIQNLLQQHYPCFDIVFVDDGSKDDTYHNVLAAFSQNKQVKICTKENGGKASALNYGIAQTQNEYVVCIDADTQLNPDAITQMMKCFAAEGSNRIGAVAGNVKVGNEKNLITRWQSIEYTTAQNFDRRAFDLVNGITVVPGAIGAFRRQAIEDAGGFTSDTLAEDCDLTIRILRKGYRVVNCNEAVAVTEAPETIKQFMKQRFRWSYGIMQAFWKNRDACFNPKYKGLGMAALPNILIFQVLLPLLAPVADAALVLSLIWNRHSPSSLHKTGWYYLLFLGAEILVSVIAFVFEGEKLKKLFWLLPQRFIYRQLMYVTLFRAISRAIKGEQQGWGVLKRTGNVRQVVASPA